MLGFGVDISEQVQAEDRLRTLINQSNSILESVGDGIYGLDLEGRVTVVNPAAAQMLGYRPQELLGRKIHPMAQHTRADGTPYLEADSAVMKSIDRMDAMRVSNEVFWRKDGTSFPVGLCGAAADRYERRTRGQGDWRGGGVYGYDRAAGAGPDEGRVYFNREPRAADTADQPARGAGA